MFVFIVRAGSLVLDLNYIAQGRWAGEEDVESLARAPPAGFWVWGCGGPGGGVWLVVNHLYYGCRGNSEML